MLRFQVLKQISRNCVQISKKTLSTTSKLNGIEIVSPTIGLTEDQTQFYNLARNFSDVELKPFACKKKP